MAHAPRSLELPAEATYHKEQSLQVLKLCSILSTDCSHARFFWTVVSVVSGPVSQEPGIEWALLSHCFALALLKPASLACAAYLWAYSSNCVFTNLAHDHRQHKGETQREYRTKTYKVVEESLLPTSTNTDGSPCAEAVASRQDGH